MGFDECLTFGAKEIIIKSLNAVNVSDSIIYTYIHIYHDKPYIIYVYIYIYMYNYNIYIYIHVYISDRTKMTKLGSGGVVPRFSMSDQIPNPC